MAFLSVNVFAPILTSNVLPLFFLHFMVTFFMVPVSMTALKRSTGSSASDSENKIHEMATQHISFAVLEHVSYLGVDGR